ncbi:MAG TPA: hypothetical protein VMU66_07315 [Gaiellales bacterium]|nr:hypothetical protein [Gaiellales bacterium]
MQGFGPSIDRGRPRSWRAWLTIAVALVAVATGTGASTALGATSPGRYLVTVSGLPGAVDGGHQASFQVSVTNTGDWENWVQFSDAASLGSVDSIDAPSGWSCAGGTCTTGPSGFAEHATVQFTVHVSGPAPQVCAANQSPADSGQCVIATTATAADDDGYSTSSAAQTAGVYPDISVTATAPAATGAGTQVSFQAVLTNSGSGDATGVTLADSLPTLAAAAPTPFAVYEPAQSSPSCASSATPAGVVVCTTGTLAPRGSVTVTVAVVAPALAVYAAADQLANSLTAADTEEGAAAVTPADDTTATVTAVYDGFASNLSGGGTVGTPGLSSVHPQRTVVTLASIASGTVTVTDSLGGGSCSSLPTRYGNPVVVSAPQASTTSPNVVQLIYSSGAGGIPAGEPLGRIQVIRQDSPGEPCVVLPQCGLIGKKSVIPKGYQACVASVKRRHPTGIVTIIVLDSTPNGDPTYRGGG